MPHPKTPRKAEDRAYQVHICTCLALKMTSPQIQRELEDNFGITMSRQNINDNYRYSRKWRPVIARFERKYLNRISHIPIASKAYRLAVLQKAYSDANDWVVKAVTKSGEVIYEKREEDRAHPYNHQRSPSRNRRRQGRNPHNQQLYRH